MLETAVQLERDPPDTETSDSMKLEEASERVKVSVEVSPALKESSASSSVMAIVGLTVSTVKVTELLASAPSSLVLPDALENLEEATEITPLVVLLAARFDHLCEFARTESSVFVLVELTKFWDQLFLKYFGRRC